MINITVTFWIWIWIYYCEGPLLAFTFGSLGSLKMSIVAIQNFCRDLPQLGMPHKSVSPSQCRVCAAGVRSVLLLPHRLGDVIANVKSDHTQHRGVSPLTYGILRSLIELNWVTRQSLRVTQSPEAAAADRQSITCIDGKKPYLIADWWQKTVSRLTVFCHKNTVKILRYGFWPPLEKGFYSRFWCLTLHVMINSRISIHFMQKTHFWQKSEIRSFAIKQQTSFRGTKAFGADFRI